MRHQVCVFIISSLACWVSAGQLQAQSLQSTQYPRVVLQNFTLSPAFDGSFSGRANLSLQRDASGSNDDNFYVTIGHVRSSGEFLSRLPAAVDALADDLKKAPKDFDQPH
jgi:hypothetical protein